MCKRFFKVAYLSAVVLLSFTLSSCNENSELVDVNSLENPNEVSYGVFDDLAKTLALSLKDETLQDFLKEEAELEKDGDFDILFAEVLNKKVEPKTKLRSSERSSSTFKDYLGSAVMTKSSAQMDIEQMCNDIFAQDPLLQIAIPNMENASWDDIKSGKTPFYVAYIPDNYDDKIRPDFPAYDQDGNISMLSGETAPETPVVIISKSERIFYVSKSESYKYSESYKLFYETEDKVYFLRDFINVSNDLPEENIPVTKSLSYERENEPGKMEYIHQAKFKNNSAMKKYENWSAGRPEIAVVVSFMKNLPTTKEVFYSEKGWAGGNLRTLDTQILRWNPDELGEYIAYHWREVDINLRNLTITIEFPFTKKDGSSPIKVTASFKIGNLDDVIGTSFVNYYDALGTNYQVNGTDDFIFRNTIK